MNLSIKTKNELIKREFEKPCCKIAALAGLLRTSGSVVTNDSLIGFSVIGEAKILKYFSRLIFALYSEKPNIIQDANKQQRARMELVSTTSFKILTDCQIIVKNGDSLSLQLGLTGDTLSSDCCKLAFISGAFLGSGSVTAPHMVRSTSTGYHLEFVFSQYLTALHFSELFSSFNFFTKLIERKDYYVVYLKNAEAVNDALTLLGATKMSLELTDIIIRKDIKNKLNRNLNCEMANMNKLINAAIADRDAINIIEQTIGFSKLAEPLRVVAEARQCYEHESLAFIADELNITKSCLSHRLRKIREIARELSE